MSHTIVRTPQRSVRIAAFLLYSFYRFVENAYRYNYCKENQLDAQLTLSIFRQPLHVSGVSRPIIRRYNRMYTTISVYYSF